LVLLEPGAIGSFDTESPRDLLRRSAGDLKEGCVIDLFIQLASSSAEADNGPPGGEPLELRALRRLPGILGALGADIILTSNCGTPRLVLRMHPPLRQTLAFSLIASATLGNEAAQRAWAWQHIDLCALPSAPLGERNKNT